MAIKQHDDVVRAAADWWVRLREPQANDSETFEQWLAWTDQDPRHLEVFERMNDLGEQLSKLDRVSRQGLINAFARPVSPQRRWVPMAAAASILAAVLAGAGYVAWTRMGAGVATQTYQSDIAQNRDITLPDGSKVALGAASAITVRFDGDQRRVELSRGEAYFQVVHDEAHPFVVTAGDVAVRDIGTAFDVRRTGDRVAIAITQGRVAIADRRSGAGAQATLEAVAGQRVSYDPNASSMTVGSMAAEQATAWRDDRLEFIDEPLSVVVDNLNRYTRTPLHVADADLGQLHYTGTVRVDAMDGWLHALPEVFPVRVTKQSNGVVLSDAQRSTHH
ncbi:FecR domain-containing protein [Dyella sp. 2HG41-7]|uniref:FecR family protein n=1 Tax=Dyella sp. 2HG41-7 TaxID=2883239 RepID=UPI001F36ADAC|nr:FecR domain-containing protein [Dyella sp. 2HG41-7]